MPKVLNKRFNGVPEGAVYVGRPSKWGNPFHIKESIYNKAARIYTREESVELYELYIINNDDLFAHWMSLKAKT